MLKTIIVDDVQADIDVIKKIATQALPKIFIVGTATTLAKAEELIARQKPDLVFLDIQMDAAGTTSFSLLEKLGAKNIDFKIVFVTAYGLEDPRARAIQYAGIEMVQKTIDKESIANAVTNTLTLKQSKELYAEAIQIALDHIGGIRKVDRKIILYLEEGNTVPVFVQDILYCESDGGNAKIFLNDQKTMYYSTKGLKYYTLLLKTDDFCRIHNQYLINLNRVKEFNKYTRIVQLDDKKSTTFEVARERVRDFMTVWEAAKPPERMSVIGRFRKYLGI